MARSTHPSRPASLAATATTIAALIAVMASASTPGPVQVERRPAETQIRVVAAAMAAAARDLLGVDRDATGATWCEAITFERGLGTPPQLPALEPVVLAPPRMPAQRLLDLPPPTC